MPMDSGLSEQPFVCTVSIGSFVICLKNASDTAAKTKPSAKYPVCGVFRSSAPFLDTTSLGCAAWGWRLHTETEHRSRTFHLEPYVV